MSVLDEQQSDYAWSENLQVDVRKMDSQHKALLITVNKLHELLLREGDIASINELFSDLIRQTRVHFKTEERFMKKFDYPDYENHKLMHDLLIDQLEDVQVAQQAIESQSFEQHWFERLELADFLRTWLFSHIVDEDKKLGEFLKSKGVK
jgi:hemerythrin-like metal-binding protein